MPAVTLEPGVDLRPAADRDRTQVGWLDSAHSFNFGPHRTPGNSHFGLLLVSNDDVVAPGTGFETHPHQDMEIVTWVLDGGLVHQDSTGHHGLIHPGLAQRMSAGTGILHSEKNDSWRTTGAPEHVDPVQFVQMWVVPDTPSIEPGYEQLDITAELAAGDLVTVASGMAKHADRRAIRIRNSYAGLHAARLADGETVTLPDAPFVHLFVAKGAVDLESEGLLATGDAARITASEGRRVTAVGGRAEVLVWEMHAQLG